MVSSFLNFEDFTTAAPSPLICRTVLLGLMLTKLFVNKLHMYCYVQMYVCAWFTILRVAYLMVYIKINLSLRYLLAMRWWTRPTLFVIISHSWLRCSCRLNPILSTEVVFCTRVPSIKTKVAHSRNKMYYFIFMVCDILTFKCTWSKLWVNAFTLYVAFQYYCIASI